MTILQVCAYAAPSAGNFISSLLELESQLLECDVNTIYAFPERAKNMDWCKKMQKYTKVYFLPEAKARILPKTYKVFKNIYKENNIDIVHSHFELYDIPATIMASKNIDIYWHLHDPITISHNLRGLLWRIQYGLISRNAKLISVSDYYKDVVISLGFPKKNTITILNGIDIRKIIDYSTNTVYKYDFLTFGWDFYRKGDDIILSACDKLNKEGYKFKFLLNGNDYTWKDLDKYFNGYIPEYLECCNSVSDINQLFDTSNIFIQASRKETFSYAVCEAAYAGRPIICSDIAGLEWAHNVPYITFFQNENVDELYNLMKKHLDKQINYNLNNIKTGQNYIKDNHSITIWAKNIIKCYNINN